MRTQNRFGIAAAAILLCAPAFGQTAQNMTFDAASVKSSESGVTLLDLLMKAYGVKTYQVIGPEWMNSERYDVDVKIPPGATPEQIQQMWQNLLAVRFGLALHHESREFQVYELTASAGGPKLKESAEHFAGLTKGGPPQFRDGGLDRPGLVTTISPGPNGLVAHTIARAQTLEPLTAMLGNQLHRPVLDKTGLSGKYDFDLMFTADISGLPGDRGTNIGSALGQLGLRLVPGKAMLDVLMIDKAEKAPKQN